MTQNLQIELTGVDKHYGGFHALKDINLSIPNGSFVALVGPSGCGKSTLLRSIAGLESITGGVMKITDEVVNDMPPRRRDVAMVFQSYALYPHMKVIDNLTYSLRLKKTPKAQARKMAEEVAATIGLETLLDRYPRELSGGQRQRVAMGRAIVRRPKVFLFDEPLSNLDASLRVHMRKEIRALHDRLGATSVYVTHDQIEAMTMADHVVVLRAGVIEQQGAPLDLYDRPASKFVAGFIGSPAMNFIPGRTNGDGTSVDLALDGQPTLRLGRPAAANQDVIVGLRPEHLSMASTGDNNFAVRVGVIESTGSTTYVGAGDRNDITVVLSDRRNISVGDRVQLAIDPDKVHLFDPITEAAL
ncbi:ABC transporter ATP-binding protein [Tritonibacter horizontis]|uniref:sn-glycerol-3-phosphate import ATP-binding protein UgpC n=1 Tax=Tritonibacter horizontis TaxID=1768241 RepID=A0A132BQU0_9RHOB|nr:sn-glycerol-3-phosphate ABC transporter ATP-binding protein UgpC [Tritonibacter horizontis]KUP90773.1 sn-glycerol-3-phosphate import ATP-binding protein UgpC [Tritonibacter horizontis]